MSLSKPDWKTLSHRVTEMHTQLGGSLVTLEGNNAAQQPLVNTSPRVQVQELVGNTLTPKKVRKFLWANRKSRQVRRPNAIVWSWYDSQEDKTFMGLGAVVEKKKIDRGLISPERVISNG